MRSARAESQRINAYKSSLLSILREMGNLQEVGAKSPTEAMTEIIAITEVSLAHFADSRIVLHDQVVGPGTVNTRSVPLHVHVAVGPTPRRARARGPLQVRAWPSLSFAHARLRK